MKILQINKFFYVRGGASRYFFEISELLEAKGHKIAYFSMQDKSNYKSKWSKYFVSNVSFEKVQLKNFLPVLSRIFYSFEAGKKIALLLNQFKPDIAHVHSIYHHLSPSIILELKKRNIPIVQTVHDYHLISPNHTLFHNGHICEITKINNYYKAIFHKCVKNSYLATFIEVLEKYVACFTGWEKNLVDYFISPSHFASNKLREYGLAREKIVHLPNFIDYLQYQTDYCRGNYILYFGRLSEEKGLKFLLKVMSFLPEIQLKIVGEGPEKSCLKNTINYLHLSNVKIGNHLSDRDLIQTIFNARFTILSSLFFENCPNMILESFASGKPVVASNIGGIPELIQHGINGLLFEPGNIQDCKEKIIRLWKSPNYCKKMGMAGRKYLEKNFQPDIFYNRLINIYQKAINMHNSQPTF